MTVLEIYLEILTNFFEILYPPLQAACEMNKEQFLRYFKKKENTSENNEDITITNVVTSATKKKT